MTSFSWPPSSGGIPIYANVAAFPVGTIIGQQAIDASGIPNLYEWTGSAWVQVAGSGVGVNAVGTFDGISKSTNGAVISGGAIFFQSADNLFPGMLTTGIQDIVGAKSFLNPITSVVTTGTAPLVIASTTRVANLNVATSGQADNLNGGAAASIPYQSSANTTAFLANGTAGQALLSAGTTLPPVWTTLAGTISLGAFDAQAGTANGLALVSNVLSAQSASASVPGMINLTTQTLGTGAKTFSTSVISPIFQTTSGNPATGGVIRLGNNELIEWRTQNAGANRTLGLNNSNVLESTATFQTDGQLISTTAIGTAPLVVTSTTLVPNLYVARAVLADVGTAVTTTATNSTNTAFFPTFVASDSSGNQGLDTASGLTFNPGTAVLATGSFVASTSFVSPVFQTSASNPAVAGAIRLANTQGIFFRNFANSADLSLNLDASNHFNFNAPLIVGGRITATNDQFVSSVSTGVAPIAVSSTTLCTNLRADTCNIASNIIGGAGGQLLYQSSSSSTAAISNGTVGQLLQANGTTVAPSWVSTSGIFTAPAITTYSQNLNTGATDYSFLISAGNTASIGAVYTNNGQNYTLTQALLIGDQFLFCSGTGTPTASGTLTYSSGTHTGGNITFSSPGYVYTLPTPNPLYIKLTVVGGGGGGGGAPSTLGFAGSGGGGSGATTINFISSFGGLPPLLSVIVGSGGAGGAANTTGSNGKTSYFASGTYSAEKGSGGNVGTLTAGGLGGIGGTPGNGNYAIGGGPGGTGCLGVAASATGLGGVGGSSTYGGGGTTGGTALGYGGGGGGNDSLGFVGNGADGAVIVEAYYQ